MSEISDAFSGYHKAIESASKRHGQAIREQLTHMKANAAAFRRYLKEYRDSFQNDPNALAEIKEFISSNVASPGQKIEFAAIDGACFKQQSHDFLVFGCVAYAVHGFIEINEKYVGGEKAPIQYHPKKDDFNSSVIGYLPVPFSLLQRTQEDPYTAYSDTESIDNSNIDRQLMRLAEIKLAIEQLESQSPSVLLVDYSISSLLVSNGQESSEVDMLGYPFQGRGLREQDVVIGYARPFQSQLNVPHPKWTRLDEWVLREITENGPASLRQLYERSPYRDGKHKSLDEFIAKVKPRGRLKNTPEIDSSGGKIFSEFHEFPAILWPQTATLGEHQADVVWEIHPDYERSWDSLTELFNRFCQRIFRDRDAGVLIYQNLDGEDKVITQRDLAFLISIGLRYLMGQCWRTDTMLLGISKESGSSFLSRNYFGILQHASSEEFQPHSDPGFPEDHTMYGDRNFLETIPFIEPDLESPWTTVEFDACFMTIARRSSGVDADDAAIQGVRGLIVAPQPGLLARSLAQFYLRRNEHDSQDVASIVAGHVIFIDRLANPTQDAYAGRVGTLTTKGLGIIKPLHHHPPNAPNPLQDAAMLIIDQLTRNLYPEVIGRPDAMHRADWGARSLIAKLKPVVQSSTQLLKRRGLRQEAINITQIQMKENVS